jgi:hypothetical protein
MKAVQPAGGDARAHPVPAHAEPDELGPGDHPVLALRKRGYGQIKLTRSTFRCHIRQKVERMANSPPSGRRVRLSAAINSRRSNA